MKRNCGELQLKVSLVGHRPATNSVACEDITRAQRISDLPEPATRLGCEMDTDRAAFQDKSGFRKSSYPPEMYLNILLHHSS